MIKTFKFCCKKLSAILVMSVVFPEFEGPLKAMISCFIKYTLNFFVKLYLLNQKIGLKGYNNTKKYGKRMKIYSVILGTFLLGACSLKDQAIVDTNLKSQTLMFTQKYKITQDKINAIVTMSYLNPILDKTSKDDVLALSFTPNTLKIKI